MEADKYGFCCVCHKNMIIQQVIGGKAQHRFSSDYEEDEYLLDNHSKMKVAMCKPCKESITPDDYPKIMEAVVAGWEREINDAGWSEQQKKDYMDKFGNIKIICKTNNNPDYVLEKTYQDYKNGVADGTN